MNTSAQTKPSIVFCHGIWADGSSFSKVMLSHPGLVIDVIRAAAKAVQGSSATA
jgi:hypothetical protein